MSCSRNFEYALLKTLFVHHLVTKAMSLAGISPHLHNIISDTILVLKLFVSQLSAKVRVMGYDLQSLQVYRSADINVSPRSPARQARLHNVNN